MDLTVVSLPAPRKKTALGFFLQAFPLPVLSPGEASCLSEFLSPHPAKWSKKPHPLDAPGQPSPRLDTPHVPQAALHTLQMGKGLEIQLGMALGKQGMPSSH